MFRISVPIRVSGILLLDPSRIGQDNPAEILCAGGAEDTATKALCDQSREVPAVIEVRVREDDCVNLLRRDRKLLPVTFAKFLEPLEETGVDEYFGAPRF